MQHRKTLNIVLALALIVGVIGAAGAAQAQTPPPVVNRLVNLMPNDNFEDKNQLSDGFDGVDSLAHLTAVASTDADRVTWYACNAGANPGTAGCNEIASDTTGLGVTDDSEAYDAFWDIPATFNNQDFDIVSRACNGAPGTGTPTPSNCRDTREASIKMDDGATRAAIIGPTEEVPTGEIVSTCPFAESTLQGECADGNFTADGHGGVLPADGFTLRFRTSDDVTPASACLDAFTPASPATGGGNPGGCDIYPTQVQLVQSTATFREWDAAFADGYAAGEYDVAIFGDGVDDFNECPAAGGAFAGAGGATNYGAGFANYPAFTEICVLDEHYKATEVTGARGTVVTFLTQDDLGRQSSCARPDREEDNDPNDIEGVIGCLNTSQGQPRTNQPVTFELSGVGSWDDSGNTCGHSQFTPGTLHDHDGDGLFEHCHTVTSTTATNWTGFNEPAGSAQARLENPLEELGDTNVTFCFDPENAAGSEEFPGVGHGCADETDADKDEAVKHWVGGDPDNITLVFDDGDGDCTGPTTLNNEVGDNDTLIACVTDAFGNLVTTEPTDPDDEDGSLQWEIEQGADTQTNTHFDPSPPQETDAGGVAEAQITADSPGTDNIRVTLLDEDGDFVDSEFVQKRVTGETGGGGGPRPGPGSERAACTEAGEDSRTRLEGGGFLIVGTDQADALIGSPGPDIICGLAGNDAIDGLGKNDIIFGDAGNDQISGGGGKDQIAGGGGDDTISGNDGNDAINGGAGDDQLKGNGGIDNIRGRGGADSIQGGNNGDILKGGGGNDTIRGGKGRDLIDGGAGTDQCLGNAGRDRIRRCER